MSEANLFPPRLLVDAPTLAHYRDLFSRLHLARYLFNSTLLAVAITLFSLLINSLAGYAFAQFRFAGRNPERRLWQQL